MAKKLTTPEVVAQFKLVHPPEDGKWPCGYDKVRYVNDSTKVRVDCYRDPEHGEFLIAPTNHKQGNGCPKCGRERAAEVSRAKTPPWSEMLERFRAVHGDTYIYDKAEKAYVNVRTPVPIGCREPGHGYFPQVPYSHAARNGCPICANRIPIDYDTFVRRATEAHEGKFSYDHLRDTFAQIVGQQGGIHNYTQLECPKHGWFPQIISMHMRGAGCKACAMEEIQQGRIIPWDEVLGRFRAVHADTFDYTKSQAAYRCFTGVIPITCPKHGEFFRTADKHANGSGCPMCQETQGERAVSRWLDQRPGLVVERQWLMPIRGKGRRYQADFLLPEYKIIVEYDGEQHLRPDGRSGCPNEAMRKFKETQENDRRKNQWAADHGHTMIRVPWVSGYHCGPKLVTYVAEYLDRHLKPLLTGETITETPTFPDPFQRTTPRRRPSRARSRTINDRRQGSFDL